jgi:DNA-binding transcriptional MerR regulator
MEGFLMKSRIMLAVALLSLTAVAQASSSPCSEKEQSILKEISYAEQHGNDYRLSGLKKALSEVRAHCNDDQVRADHRKDIAEKREEVAERQAELDEAKRKGDPEKIAKRERKLAEEVSELKALEAREY